MKRIVVIGTTGSGKSRLAERLGRSTGLRVVELDKLYWGRDWQPAPVELFRHRVEREIKDEGWIVVGNYGQVRDLVWPAADTFIWLDLPFPLVMSRLVRRTVKRAVTRENLWGTGNTESLLRSFFSRQSILWWAVKTHRRNRAVVSRECGSLAKEKKVVRLQSRRAVRQFVQRGVAVTSPSSPESRTVRGPSG